jgi:hypothetical protein
MPTVSKRRAAPSGAATMARAMPKFTRIESTGSRTKGGLHQV